jgi:asparagine synthase (glutamine-hydrolysing)
MTRYLLVIPRGDGASSGLACLPLAAAHPFVRSLRHLRLGPSDLFFAGHAACCHSEILRLLIGGIGNAELVSDLANGRHPFLPEAFASSQSAALGHIEYHYDPDRQSHRIYRDPSGHVPCYHYAEANHDIFMSDLDMARTLRGIQFLIDDDALARTLAFPTCRDDRTAIVGVTEVLPGHAMVLELGRTEIQTSWSPWDHSEAGESADEPTRLRDAIVGAVAMTANGSDHVLLELSGGLDSSILAACLHRLGATFSVVTYVPFGPKGDERHFADTVARAYGCAAFVRYPDASHIDPVRSRAAHLPRPSARCFSQEFERLGAELAAEIGAHAVLNGGAGDTVLGYFPSAAPVVDRWRAEGSWSGLADTVRDVAISRNVSMRAVVLAAIQQARRARRTPSPAPNLSFLTLPTVERITAVYHPWLDQGCMRLPGKLSQIRSLVGIYAHLEGAGRGPEVPMVYPFMMQPVLEAALRIPSWRSCAGGRDRAVARAAFADDLPDLIRLRRSKGTFDGLTFDIFHRHRSLIADMILDGHLARTQMVDREAVATYFRQEAIPRGRDLNRLLALVDCEAWIAATTSSARDARQQPSGGTG